MPTPAALDAAINPGQKSLPYSFRLFHTQGERAHQQAGKSQYWRRASTEVQVFEQESDAHVEGTAEFSLCHLITTPPGNPAIKNWEKKGRKGRFALGSPSPKIEATPVAWIFQGDRATIAMKFSWNHWGLSRGKLILWQCITPTAMCQAR